VAGIERLVTHKGQTLTVTGRRTGGVTQQLVIPLWTLRPSITQVTTMKTYIRQSAPIITCTIDVIAADLVLAARTILDAVTPEVDRQAVHLLTRTTKVGLWTSVTVWIQSLCGEAATTIHVNDNRGLGSGGYVKVLSAIVVTEVFITAVQTVVPLVAHFAVVNPLFIGTTPETFFFVLAVCFVRSVSAVTSEVTHQRVVNSLPVLIALKHLHTHRFAVLCSYGHRTAS
jgi:hypothetical protein